MESDWDEQRQQMMEKDEEDDARLHTCTQLLATAASLLAQDLVKPQHTSMVGTLQYLTTTRPDLLCVVNYVCQFIKHCPKNTHWTTVERI